MLSVNGLLQKMLYMITYSTLTFDLSVKLTFHQFQQFININHICKYYHDPIIRS